MNAGLSQDIDGNGKEIHHTGRMRGISGKNPLARRIHLSRLSGQDCMARSQILVGMRKLPPADKRDGGHSFRELTHAFASVVSRDLVGGGSKERRQCAWLAARPWTFSLQNSVNMASQNSARDGCSRTLALERNR